MSDEFRYRINLETQETGIPRFLIRILYCCIVGILALLSYCCCRQRRDTGTVLSQPVADSYSNTALFPPIPLPPPRTNHYQTPHIQPRQPASSAPSASDASDPPSCDQIIAKQPPYNQAAL